MEWFPRFLGEVVVGWRSAESDPGSVSGDGDMDFIAALGRGLVAAKLAAMGFATWAAPGSSPPAGVWGARLCDGVIHVVLIRVRIVNGRSRPKEPDEADARRLLRLAEQAWEIFRGSAVVPDELKALPRVFSAGDAEVRVDFDGAAFQPAVARGRYLGARRSSTLKDSWQDRERVLEVLHTLG